MSKNIGKLYEAFDAFTNKDFDAAEDMLHEFLVLSAKEQLKESWNVSEESYYEDDEIEDEFGDDELEGADEIGGDMDDDFIGDVTVDDAMGDDFEADAPATKQDVMDLEDKIDQLVAEFEADDADEDEDFDDEAEDEIEDDFDDEEDEDEDEDLDEDIQLDEEDDAIEEGVDFKQNIKGAEKKSDSATSPAPKQNKGGKIEGQMGKTEGNASGRPNPAVKKDEISKDGNQGSGKDRQKKVSDKAAKSSDGVKSMEFKG